MLDKLFAAIGMGAVIAFMAVVTIFVMEPDLWIVTLLGLAIAVKFLWQEVKTGGSHVESDSESGTDA
jgi:hypothetical protein